MFANFFKYIYYRIYCFSIKLGEGSPGVYAAGIMTAIISSNILFVTYIVSFYQNFIFSFSYWDALIVVAMLFIINLLLFKDSYNESAKKWDNEDESMKQLKGVLIFVYFILSMASLLIWATYMYNQKHPSIGFNE